MARRGYGAKPRTCLRACRPAGMPAAYATDRVRYMAGRYRLPDVLHAATPQHQQVRPHSA
jgi:hypothetical protein